MSYFHRFGPPAVVILILVLALPACGPGKETEQAARVEGAGEVVATYGKHKLTLDDFEAEVEKLPPQVQPMLSSPERRKQFLETFIISQLLIDEARAKGLDKDEEIRKQVEETEKRLILQRAYGDLQQAVSVTDAEVEAYYNANPNEFSTAEIRASHILVEDEATAAELLKKARANPDSFAKLAKENSKDTATAPNGGDLGFFGRGRMVPDFEKAAFALEKPGDISEVVKSPFGYHIIMLDERKEGEKKPLDQVKEQIRVTLLQQKQEKSIEAHFDKLKADNQVRINDDVLAKFTAAPSGGSDLLMQGAPGEGGGAAGAAPGEGAAEGAK